MAFELELPDIGEGVVEAEVQQWFVAPGDEVEEDQPLVEVMTDKATVVIPSPRRGKVVKLHWNVGDVAKVHSPLVSLDVGEGAPAPAKPPASAAPPAPKPTPTPTPAPTKGKPLATPAVRALARELEVDLAAVSGTGPGGRVTKDDLAAHGRAPAPAAPSSRQPAAGDERVPLRGIRKRIAENMARSKRTAAHFTFVEQVDATRLVAVKDRIAQATREEGVKVTFLPFVLKAASQALRRHRKLNATMDEEKAELVLHGRQDFGVASSTEDGLVVPVVRGVDARSILDLAREIERLSAGTKAGKVRPEDLGRSTFTVTSLGALGGLFATPVLNHPEVAILGLYRMRPTPVVRDGQVVVRDVMHLSVTCDHRVVDGHEAAAFAYDVIRLLEDPDLLLANMA